MAVTVPVQAKGPYSAHWVYSTFLLFQDVPLISLANIFHNAKLWNDAIIVATMAVEIAPHFVVNHFTLANVYVAMVSEES